MSIDTAIKREQLLAPLTTIGLGGPAAEYVRLTTVNELREALQYADRQKLPLQILAGGSNTIFSDKGFSGLVIHINLKGIQFEGAAVTAAAGEVWDDVVAETVQRDLTGMEAMSGIPGSVGATPIQNVGAYGQEVAEIITRIEALDRESMEVVRFSREDCDFDYRTSRFKTNDRDRFIVTKVVYQLFANREPEIRYPQLAEALPGLHLGGVKGGDVREAVLRLRARKSMLVDAGDPNSRSCGSFFVNPIVPIEVFERLRERYPAAPHFLDDKDPSRVKIPAAWLIEQAGFSKGLRRDGVGISENHPLALVNYDGSTKALLSLAAEIEAAVNQKFNIQLVREPVVVL